MIRFVHIYGCIIGCLFCLLPHFAWAHSVAIVYSVGYKLDKSFNESAFNGVQELRKNGYSKIIEYTPRTPDESVSMIKTAAGNADQVVAIGYTYQDIIYTVAPNYPKTRFSIIDGYVPLSNVQSVTFREHEGAFLAGVIAAKSSHSGTIGFIGGMSTPVINRFQAGYEAGARYVSPEIKIISYNIGDDIMSFSDPMRGYLLAVEQIKHGADVIFAAAGSSGLGVYQATDEAVCSAIGVDSDQNHLFPTTILTSLIKDVGKTLIHVIKTAHSSIGREDDELSMGLKENALYMSLNTNQADLYPPRLRSIISKIRLKIISGEIQIPSKPEHIAPIHILEPN